MPDGYGTHSDFLEPVIKEAEARCNEVQEGLRAAFPTAISIKEVEVISFADLSAIDIARGISQFPVILKSLLAVCNIGARAIERDLDIRNLDTYGEKINEDVAKVVAGYIKPFLPAVVELPTLCTIDRVAFIDKEIRKTKGRWERLTLSELSDLSGFEFVKRKFKVQGQIFELDAAYPAEGPIQFGIDVKRIEARRDIHKRCDEIVNKAAKLKAHSPESKFGAVIYYPFIEEHINVQNRLDSPNIDGVVFASETKESVSNAVKLLLAKIGAES